jgi:hypothetical protein
MNVFLFDVDGVLIHALGYRAALMRAVEHFATRMGLGGMAPTHAEIDVFEANGITTEWDSVPMCVGHLLLEVARQRPDALRADLPPTLEAVRLVAVSIERPDYAAAAGRVGAAAGDERPSLTALRLLRAEAAGLSDGVARTLVPLLDVLLADTHVIEAPCTRVFQHYTLGDAGFARAYRQPADFATPSLLRELDRPLLESSTRARLEAARRSGDLHSALYTARPSLPPADSASSSHDYAPEAEIALELVGMDGWPLIGFGRVLWLAERHAKRRDAYVKPSPVQALAAIGAAASGREAASLEAARTLVEDGHLSGPLAALPSRLTITVFEDTTSGVQATIQAADALRAQGIEATVRAVGVAPAGPKREALAPLADVLVDDINAGVEWALVGR